MCRTYTDYKRRMCGIFMEREQLRDRLVEAAGLPRDVLQKAPVLTVTGDFEVFIGNYRGIAEYSDAGPGPGRSGWPAAVSRLIITRMMR